MSRYRVVLSNGAVRKASVRVVHPDGAKRWAKQWGEDVGISGHIELQERDTPGWVPRGRWQVRNSEATTWEKT